MGLPKGWAKGFPAALAKGLEQQSAAGLEGMATRAAGWSWAAATAKGLTGALSGTPAHASATLRLGMWRMLKLLRRHAELSECLFQMHRQQG